MKRDITILLVLIYILLGCILVFVVNLNMRYDEVIQEKKNKWIPVTDGLPEPMSRVLAWNAAIDDWEEVGYRLEGWIRLKQVFGYPLEISHYMYIERPEGVSK